MKKTVVSLVFVLWITGIAAVPASAEEYKVVKGDSLWKIAHMHQTTVADLKKINQLHSNIIHPNQMLQIDREHNESDYTVRKGDTLSEIALSYGVKVVDLKNWNQLNSDLILIGQRLTINSSNQSKASPVAASTETKQYSKKRGSKKLTMTATAYTAECTGCSGITYTGLNLNVDRNKKVIAVDPRVIPLGTKVHVEGYGEAIAGDIGSAIKGNRIDIHVPTKEIAYRWGVKTVDVTILN